MYGSVDPLWRGRKPFAGCAEGLGPVGRGIKRLDLDLDAGEQQQRPPLLAPDWGAWFAPADPSQKQPSSAISSISPAPYDGAGDLSASGPSDPADGCAKSWHSSTQLSTSTAATTSIPRQRPNPAPFAPLLRLPPPGMSDIPSQLLRSALGSFSSQFDVGPTAASGQPTAALGPSPAPSHHSSAPGLANPAQPSPFDGLVAAAEQAASRRKRAEVGPESSPEKPAKVARLSKAPLKRDDAKTRALIFPPPLPATLHEPLEGQGYSKRTVDPDNLYAPRFTKGQSSRDRLAFCSFCGASDLKTRDTSYGYHLLHQHNVSSHAPGFMPAPTAVRVLVRPSQIADEASCALGLNEACALPSTKLEGLCPFDRNSRPREVSCSTGTLSASGERWHKLSTWRSTMNGHLGGRGLEASTDKQGRPFPCDAWATLSPNPA